MTQAKSINKKKAFTVVGKALLGLMLLSSCGKSEKKEALNSSPPNILLIHVDDLGWADVGAFGSDFYQTPNIDQLARQGMKFTQSYAAAAICSPTRAAMLTGKYPARIGITDWIRAEFQGGVLPADGGNPQGYDENEGLALKTPKNFLFMPLEQKTIAEYLKELGFATAHVGKWHLGSESHFPEQQGFDVNKGGCDLGQPPSYFDPYEPFNGNPDYIIPNLPPRKTGEYLTDREGDEVVDFISNNKDKPFFVHWASYTVHTPLMGKEEVVDKYKELPTGKQNNPTYAAMVESLDDNVGKILDALDSLGLAHNTLVIFTSDNGGLMGNPNRQVTNNAPLRSEKGYPYEGGIRIPTIMRWPGMIPENTESATPIISMDMLPTILEITGLDQGAEKVDGKSLTALMSDPDQSLDRDMFWHFPHYRGSDVVPYSIIRSGKYKLIHYYGQQQDELFDLEADQKEEQNLINKDLNLDAALLDKLMTWTEETGAKMPVKK